MEALGLALGFPMNCKPHSPFLEQLCGRISLDTIPFSERGSRLLVMSQGPRLVIRLAERWVKWQEHVGHYRQRAPILDDWTLTDADGAPLEFKLTSFPHALCFETRLGETWLAFVDEETLFLKWPVGRAGLTFRVLASHGVTDRRGGTFKGDPEHRQTHRNVAYTTNARLIANTIEPDMPGYLRVRIQADAGAETGVVLNVTPRLGFHRTVGQPAEILRRAEQRWHAWFAAAPPVDAPYTSQYYYAWWILRTGLISPRFFLTREAMMPSKTHYVGIWAWDAFFHALAFCHVDPLLAENQLRVILDHQREDGMIPDAVHDEGIVTRWPLPNSELQVEVTKPPLIAWTALKLYATSGNRDFLDEIYEPLCRWNRWWYEKNDSHHDGIVEYSHPYSSGLDDSPLWDEGMPVESPELNTYLVLQMEALGKIAQILGSADEAALWEKRVEEAMERIVRHFWDERAGVFWATRNDRPLRVLTPFNLYPLLTGRLLGAQTERLLGHLLDPDEFWTPYPIPTVAKNDPRYSPNQMWRGPTWANINYLFVEGLARCGYPDLARQLRDRTLQLLMRHPDIYEYYNPETGEPPPNAASVFGWSSAVLIDLAIKASRGEII